MPHALFGFGSPAGQLAKQFWISIPSYFFLRTARSLSSTNRSYAPNARSLRPFCPSTLELWSLGGFFTG